MLDGLDETGLPDPADVSRPWAGDLPALEAWWRRIQDWAARDEDRRPWDAVRELELIARYGEAIPTREALHALLGLGPLLEIGAGRGYWSRLLRDLGGDVIATDPAPVGTGSWCGRPGPAWTAVDVADHSVAEQHPERALLVCWPPRPGGYAAELVGHAPQRTLALVTDGPNLDGDRMYDQLHAEWTAAVRIELPHWPMRFDALTIWQRNP